MLALTLQPVKKTGTPTHYTYYLTFVFWPEEGMS
jgi:hypothetical protein